MRTRFEGLDRLGESGAVLILAMVFLLAIGLVGVATAGLAVGAGSNTSNVRAQQLTQGNVESEASIAMANARTAYNFCSGGSCYGGPSSPKICTPASAGISGLEVICEGSGGSGNGQATRTVDFFVCKSGLSSAACTSTTSPAFAVWAEVTYTDVPSGEATTNNQCTALLSQSCGITATINSWDYRLADS